MGARENSGTRKKEEELGSEICAKRAMIPLTRVQLKKKLWGEMQRRGNEESLCENSREKKNLARSTT